MIPFTNTGKVLTGDNSYTLFSAEYGENYHSLVGAIKESREKFIEPSGIIDFENPKLLDIGFGLGYNALLTYFSVRSIEIVSLEKDESLLSKALELHGDVNYKNVLQSLIEKKEERTENKKIELLFGDARTSVKSLVQNKREYFTHIFLDAFSPTANPELWTIQFFSHLYNLLRQNGVLITYSSSLAVISALIKVGFSVEYTKAIGRKRGGTLAIKKEIQSINIDEKDHFLLKNSVHKVPNVDKGYWSKQEIQAHRLKLQNFAIEKRVLMPHKRAEKIWKNKTNHL